MKGLPWERAVELGQYIVENGATVRAAAAKFGTQYGAIAGGDTDEFLTERRDWTLSDENINMDVRTYADGDGKLHVVLPIGSIAGADSYEQVLSLDDIGE